MININLLPSAQRKPVVVFDRGMAVGIALIVVEILAIFGFSWFLDNQITALNSQIETETQKVAVEQAQVKQVDDLRDQVTQLQAKAEQLERIKQSPTQLAEVLKALGEATPSGVWYTAVNVTHGDTGGGAVALTGKTSTFRQVADLMLDLDASNMFGDATLATSTQEVGKLLQSGGNVAFTMTGQLSNAVIMQ
ncbi:MAG TPA: PilN domain-containing protein [Candidatus Eremiobacteraceae bacterium]|nr:PilN domain-containing protein [Candidatus Eremiobacteraceae bacterium]